MTVYDTANKLAQELKSSREYIEYKEIRDKIYADPNLENKVDEFEKLKYEVQMMTVHNEKQDTEKMKKLQDLYTILLNNKDIKKYFDMQIRFDVMLADINKIIAESVKDVLK